MTEQERLQQGIMDGARLSAFSTVIKRYARKWGVTPFDGFENKSVTVKNTPVTSSQVGDSVVYNKAMGLFLLRRIDSAYVPVARSLGDSPIGGGTGEIGGGVQSIYNYYSGWYNRNDYYDTDGTVLNERCFVSPEGYIINGIPLDLNSLDQFAEIFEELETANGNITTNANAISALSERIGAIEKSGLKRQIVDKLPVKGNYQDGKIPENIVFMLPVRDEFGDYFNEYMWVEAKDTYELIGSSKTSLDGYTTNADQNRLVASTIGLSVGSAMTSKTISIRLKEGDVVKLVNIGSEEIGKGKIEFTGPTGIVGTLISYSEYTVEYTSNAIVSTEMPGGIRLFITNNTVTNVGLPHLTDEDVTKIFNDAQI